MPHCLRQLIRVFMGERVGAGIAEGSHRPSLRTGLAHAPDQVK